MPIDKQYNITNEQKRATQVYKKHIKDLPIRKNNNRKSFRKLKLGKHKFAANQ